MPKIVFPNPNQNNNGSFVLRHLSPVHESLPRRSDFSIFHVAFLDLYFASILANHVESFFLVISYQICYLWCFCQWLVRLSLAPKVQIEIVPKERYGNNFCSIFYNENSAELTRFCSTLANWKTLVVFLVFSVFHPSHMKLCNFRTPFLSLIGRSRYCYAGSNVRIFWPGE